jgi:glutaredoxin
VEFIAKDIKNDIDARKELVEKYGRMATPTLVINGKVILGFRQNQDVIEREIAILKGAING